ncbi:MAG: hypothetical protein LBT82_02250 [Oscillospiraceae bacterium]|jgi:GH25 family lysozyme M1 (1,4-beta-N-acetylmuramidase)|nr:hypothetical protein [Oscillospiraceae bacterium]
MRFLKSIAFVFLTALLFLSNYNFSNSNFASAITGEDFFNGFNFKQTFKNIWNFPIPVYEGKNKNFEYFDLQISDKETEYNMKKTHATTQKVYISEDLYVPFAFVSFKSENNEYKTAYFKNSLTDYYVLKKNSVFVEQGNLEYCGKYLRTNKLEKIEVLNVSKNFAVVAFTNSNKDKVHLVKAEDLCWSVVDCNDGNSSVNLPVAKIDRRANNPILGIDISQFNAGYEDLVKKSVLENAAQLVIIRACSTRGCGGLGGYREFENYTDEKFEFFLQECLKFKVPFGVYFAARFYNQETVKTQAKYFLDLVNKTEKKFNIKINFPLILDLEPASSNDVIFKKMSEEKTLINLMDVFCKELESCNRTPMIYINKYFAEKVIGIYNKNNPLSRYYLWLARYPYTHPTKEQLKVENLKNIEEYKNQLIDGWQYTSSGPPGEVDWSMWFTVFPENNFFG